MKRRNLASLLATLTLSALTGTNALAADKVDITLTAGTEANQDGLYYATLVLLDKELKKQTNNQVKLRIYPNQQLGNEMSMIEGLRSGSLDIAVAGGANFASFVPQFQLFSVPYVFPDQEKYRRAMQPDSKVWQLMQKSVADAKVGVQLMAPTTVGSRWVANTKGDVKSPADMKALALRMRVQANPIEAEVWSSYGASPVNMPMPEVVTAMRQGVVQAVENAPDILYTYKLHEVAKHLSQTDHSFYVAVVLMSDRASKKIPAELQPAVRKAFLNAGQQLLDQSTAFQEKAIAGMKTAGATVVQVDKAAFRKPIEPVYDRVAKEVGATDILAAIRGL
jgi:tripartite ATP-independent transporter DctP family solute receptor